MPIYSYRCPEGHDHDHLHRASDGDRPASIDCPKCGSPAIYVIAAPARGIVTGTATPGMIASDTRKRGADVKGLRVIDWTCENGHEDFDVTDADTYDIGPCKVCGSKTRRLWAMPSLDWFTAAYPNGYHEPQLGFEHDADGKVVVDDNGVPVGRFIRDRKHMEEVCREMGVQPIAKDECIRLEDDYLRAEADKAAAEDAEVHAMLAQNEWGPEAADMKRARDNGLVFDWTEHARNLGVPLSHQD